jgi:hypothetical protein
MKEVERAEVMGDTKEEQIIIDLMKAGESDLELIQIKSHLDPVLFSQTITMLEINGKIRPLGAAHWALK